MQLIRPEPELQLGLGRLGRVGRVHEVLADLDRVVAANRACRRLKRIGRADQLTGGDDRLLALEDRGDEVMKSTSPVKNGFSRWIA